MQYFHPKLQDANNCCIFRGILYPQDAGNVSLCVVLMKNTKFLRRFIIDMKNAYVVVLSRKDMGAKKVSSA